MTIRSTISLMAAVALPSLVNACARPRTVDGAPPVESTHAPRAQIGATAREFSARYERGDASGMAALYTDDGVIFPPGRLAIRGRTAIESYWRLAPDDRITSHRVTSDSVVIEGRAAYDWGTYTVSGVRRGEPFSGGGKYVIVWREVSPGTWRMHLDMWNALPPARP